MRDILPTLLYMLTSIAGYGQSLTSLSPGQLQQLDAIATQYVPSGAPGIATGIVENGRIIYQKVAGFADLSDSTLITAGSRFNIASNGKQFTALAILILIDEKKLSLDDDIRKYLPAIYTPPGAVITIRDLLEHTSGIRDVYDLWSLQGVTWWEHSFNNTDAIKLLEKQRELNFMPGSKYLYSNSNYILLASIIEKVTGQSFISFTNQVFKKLKMPDTSFEDNYARVRGPIAKAYFNFGTWTTYDWIWNIYGDGNIFSTLSDQLHWEQILQGKADPAVKKSIIQKSQQLIEQSGISNYGYGLEFGTYKGLPYKFHEGATGAWKATVLRFPNQKLSLVTITNSGKITPDRQTRQMADVYLGLKEDKAFFLTKPAKTGRFLKEDDIIGIYQTDDLFTFQFEKRDSAIYLKRIGRNDVRLEREADNIFHQTYDSDFKQEFRLNALGEMEVTAYYTSHAPYTLKRVNTNWNGFSYDALNGRFFNAETDVTIEITFTGERNYNVKIGSQEVSKALLISPVRLLVDDYSIEFDRSTPPATLLLNAARIKNCRFRRVD